MAELHLSRTQADEADCLLPLCMHCAAPATMSIARKFRAGEFESPPMLDFFGLLLQLLFFTLFLKSKSMTVRLPLCAVHRRGSVPQIAAKSVTDDHIILTGVCDEFVRNWQAKSSRSPGSMSIEIPDRAPRTLDTINPARCPRTAPCSPVAAALR